MRAEPFPKGHATVAQPRLWHLPSSHFSEKVRWTLDHKRIPHTRRVPLVVPHFVVSLALTGGESHTFPVLELEGRSIGDSTAILEALERLEPAQALYPANQRARSRAVALEDWFDEELGSHVRLLALNEASQDLEVLEQLASRHTPAYMKPFPTAWARSFGGFLRLRYGLDRPGAAEEARAAVVRAFERLERELGDSDYLVDDSFTVADLAAASHFYWLVQPPEGPQIVDRLPHRLADFMSKHEDRRGYRWVEEIYRRHRRPVAPSKRPVRGS